MKKTITSKKNQNNLYVHYCRPCPNAAEPQYFIDKLVDGALAIVTSMGTLTILFFLITM
mgnify:CR=1 FL=1